MEKVIIEGENPVHDFLTKPSGILSSAEHEKFCVKQRGHPVRLNTPERPIANQYREER